MPLGMEIGLGPGDFVLDGDPAPLPQKGAEPPGDTQSIIPPYYRGRLGEALQNDGILLESNGIFWSPGQSAHRGYNNTAL